MPEKNKISNLEKALKECISVGSVGQVAKKLKVHPTALRYHLRKNPTYLKAFRAAVVARKKARKAEKKKAA